MESYLAPYPFDLATPDGAITKIHSQSSQSFDAEMEIHGISPAFVGFSIDKEHLCFNLKSTLAQLGLDATATDIQLDRATHLAIVHVTLTPRSHLAAKLLPLLSVGAYIGKLFAADPRRRVRNPDYLTRMFGRTDRDGDPLLSLGEGGKKDELILEKREGHTFAFLNLKKGVIEYTSNIDSFLPTLAKALCDPSIKTRQLVELHQTWNDAGERKVHPGHILLVKTAPLHIRTAFARVVPELLPSEVFHTTADILQPDTAASGDIYELFGNSPDELTQIPLEFYTLEPHREHVFFEDRDQLQASLDDPKAIFQAFESAPFPDIRSSVFVVKGEQLLNLQESDWIARSTHQTKFPGLYDLKRQAEMVQDYIDEQPATPFLKAIEEGLITSQGVLFCRYFPSPFLEKLLLADLVQTSLKGIYFQVPSQSYGDYFSHEDRSLLQDLAKFAIPVFWADKTCGKVLQYAPKPEKDAGMFVPIHEFDTFVNATSFGVYGSALIELAFEENLTEILEGILGLKKETKHPLLNAKKPIALITGGGPGLMEVSNRIAKSLNILSCANIVDFRKSNVLEQRENPYIDAKMTYRIDKLVERQSEFNLDFPIFLTGGIGTDFEFALENVRRKVGVGKPTPAILLGDPDYWRSKITSTYQANVKAGTTRNSEWVSNCFWCADSPTAALQVYREFFSGTLPIGPDAPPAPEGFFIAKI